MILYSLCCEAEHAFEGWFRSSADFDAQAERGLLTCPVCGSASVTKSLMAPAVARRDLPTAAPAEAPAQGVPDAPGPVALLSERDQELRAMVRAFRAKVTEHAENVGDRFAETARQMHNEEVEKRSIYGRATAEEARALVEEGIEFSPLPSLPEERS